MLRSFVLFVSSVVPPAVFGQSLIVGVPSTDVTPKGHVMIAHESQFNRFQAPRNYWNSFTFGTIGLGANTEFAATLYGPGRPATGNNTLAIGLKHRMPLAKAGNRWEPTLAVGAMLPFSLVGRGTGYWGYSAFSFRLPTKTRITAGPSHGTRQVFGVNATKAIVGIEHPFNKKWMFVADWMSGTHDLAASIWGMAYHVNPQLVVIAGYKIPNNARSGKPAPLLEITYTFGKHE